MEYVIIALVLACIATTAFVAWLFWHKGRAWFGSSTHPAALFILVLLASGFICMFILPAGQFTNFIIFVTTAVSFTIFHFRDKRTRARADATRDASDGTANK